MLFVSWCCRLLFTCRIWDFARLPRLAVMQEEAGSCKDSSGVGAEVPGDAEPSVWTEWHGWTARAICHSIFKGYCPYQGQEAGGGNLRLQCAWRSLIWIILDLHCSLWSFHPKARNSLIQPKLITGLANLCRTQGFNYCGHCDSVKLNSCFDSWLHHV